MTTKMDANSTLYDDKVREMKQYIPLLVQLIGKLETNQDGRGEGKESQLSKMRMLHRLLTKNEKKLKLETLLKCEAVLQKIAKKLGKGSDGRKSHDQFNIDELSAPASPSERDNSSQFHSPIVIPTERKSSPMREHSRRDPFQGNRDSEKYYRSDAELFRRRSPTRRDHSKTFSSNEHSGYFRQSPALRRDNYEEKYRNPDHPDRSGSFDRQCQSKSPNFDMLKDKTRIEDSHLRNSPALEHLKSKVEPKRVPTPLSEVLRSPPLSANDIVDLMNESEDKDERKDANALDKLNAVRKKLHNEIINSKRSAQISPIDRRQRDTPPLAKHEQSSSKHFVPIHRSSSNLKDINPPHRFDSQHSTKDNYFEDQRSDDRHLSNFPSRESSDRITAPRDPRERIDKEDHSNIRLAYKYNPHPRKHSEPVKNDELPTSHISSNNLSHSNSNVAISKPTINTLPGVNLADPRLRNRPMNFMMPEKTCHPPNQMDIKTQNSAFVVTENRRPSSAMSLFPSYTGYNQQMTPQPVPPPNVPSQMMHHVNHHNIPPLPVPPPLPVLPPSPTLMSPRPPNRPPIQDLMTLKINHNPLGGTNMAYNKFQPALNDQVERMKYLESKRNKAEPKTYGEYKQAKLAEQKFKESQESNQSATGQKTPVEAAPSCLDKFYRSSNYNIDTPSINSFKIPKIKKEEATDSNKINQDEVTGVKPECVETKKPSKEDHNVEESTRGQITKTDIKTEKTPKIEANKEKISKVESSKEKTPKVETNKEKTSKVETKKEKTSKVECNKEKTPKIEINKEKTPKVETNKEKSRKIETNKEKTAKLETNKEKTPKVESNKEKTPKVEANKEKIPKHELDKEQAPNIETNIEANKEKVSKIETSNEKICNVETNNLKDSNIEVVLQEEPLSETEDVTSKIKEDKTNAKSKKDNHKKQKTKKVKTFEKPLEKKEDPEEIDESTPADEFEDILQESPKITEDVTEENDEVIEEKSEEQCDKEDHEFVEMMQKALTRGRRPIIVSSTTDSCEVSTQNILTGKRRTRSLITVQSEATPSKEKEKANIENKRKTPPAVTSKTTGKTVVQSTPKGGKNKRATNGRFVSVTRKRQQTKNEEKHDDCVVSSTTTGSNEELHNIVQSDNKKEDGKEWLEGFLSNITNPALNKKETVLNILEKVLDEDKLKQIREILDNKCEQQAPTNEAQQAPVLTPVEEGQQNCDIDLKVAEPKEHHTKRKTELDRLNEDIRDMFISKGVLTATGKRMCTILTEEKKKDEASVKPKTPEPVKTPTTKKVVGKVPVKRLGKGKGIGKGKKGSAAKRVRKQKKTPELVPEEIEDSDENSIAHSPVREEVDLPPPVLTPQVKKSKNRGYKPCPKSKRKFMFDSEEEENTNSEPEVIFEVEIDPGSGLYEEQAEIIEEEVEIVEDDFEIIEDEKSDSLEEDSGQNFVSSFKNTNKEWHSKSDAAKKCIICSFAGEKMGNHYIRSHPDIEFPIARLPPHILKSMKEGVSSTIARKKGSNWQQQCLFCNDAKTLSPKEWIDHYSSHTGEYGYKCSQCDKQFDTNDSVEYHLRLQCPQGKVLHWQQFECEESFISAYSCDICGYIKLNRDSVLMHLKSQHNEIKEDITKITLMKCEDPAKEKQTKEKASFNSKLDESQLEVFMPKQNDVNLDPNFIKYMKDISFSTADSTKRPSLSIVDQLSERLKKTSDKKEDDDDIVEIRNNHDSDVVLIDDTDDEVEKETVERSKENVEHSKEPEVQNTIASFQSEQDSLEKPIEETPLVVSMADRLCQRFSAAKSPADIEQESRSSNHLSLSDSQVKRFTTTVENEDQTGEAESVVYVVEAVNNLIGKEDHVKDAEAIKLPRTVSLSEMLSQRLMKDSNKLSNLEILKDNAAIENIPQQSIQSKSDSNIVENNATIKTPSKSNVEGQSTSWTGMSLVERLSQRLKSFDGNSFDKESEPNSPQLPETTSTGEIGKDKNNDDSNQDADSSFEGELIIDESGVSEECGKAEDLRSITTLSSMTTQNGDEIVQDIDEGVSEALDDDNWEDIEVLGSDTVSKEDSESTTKKNKTTKNELIFSAFSRLYKLAKKDKGKKNQKGEKRSSENNQNKSKEIEKEQFNLSHKELETSQHITNHIEENNSNLNQKDSENPSSSIFEKQPDLNTEIQPESTDVVPLLQGYSLAESQLQAPNDLIDSINLDNVVDLSMPQNDLHDLSGLLDLPATEDSSNMVIVLSDDGEMGSNDIPDTNNLPSTDPVSMTGEGMSWTTTPFDSKNSSNDTALLDDTKGKGSNSSPVYVIENMGFSKNPERVIKYHCLVDSCTFLYSEMSIGLETHFLIEHPNIFWKGYCNTCRTQICSDKIMTLSSEYKHMMDDHVNSNMNKTTEPVNKPLIKVRKISDLLSVSPREENSNSQGNEETVEPEKDNDSGVGKQKILNNLPQSPWLPPLRVTITSISTGDPNALEGQAAVTSPSSELKISSVSSNVNQDLIHNVSSNNGGFLKISEVVSLAKLPQEPKIVKESEKQSTPSSSKTIVEKTLLNAKHKIQPKSSDLNVLNISFPQTEKGKDRKSITESVQVTNQSKNVAKLLKPWSTTSSIKTREVIADLLKTQVLFSFFKCMGMNCNYSTNSSTSMRIHIHQHNNFAERQCLPADTVAMHKECPYCTYNRSKNFLIEHMLYAHEEDIYQCPYCFYRACVSYFVVTHLDTYHKGLTKTILVTTGKQKTLPKEIGNMAKLRTRHVRSIGCWDCNKKFFIIRNYVKHLEEHNAQKLTYTCWLCRGMVIKTCAEKHLFMMHNIGLCECIYCYFATNSMDEMRRHTADLHFSCLSYMCVRVAPDKAIVETTTTEETLESSTVLANLAEPLGDIPLINCRFTNEELNAKDPLMIKPNEIVPSKFIDKPSDNFRLTFDVLRNETTETTETCSQEMNRERMYLRILEAAKEMVEGTGIEPEELYTCTRCEASHSTEKEFAQHIQQHIRASELQDLKCACHRYVIKSWSSFEAHLRWHAEHHYFCYFCNHTGPTTSALCRHINDVHQKVGMISIPLIFGLKNKTKDFFVVAPRNTKQAYIDQFAERMVRAWERKKALTKKSFTPDEIDLLPRQAIFMSEVHCQVCNYRTKVRANMYRHLQFHKQEIKVATVDPVNPVPCLNSNERHFDKMVNLACSSNVNKDGSKSAAKEEPKLPEFIPSMRRYVCGVPNCTYLTISKNMLKWHLNALHSNEQTYICPHCKIDVCKKNICLDKIFSHLKFHESRLHVCEECNYTHYKRFIVERHINEKHPGQPCDVAIYTRLGTSTIKTNETVSSKPQQLSEEEKKDLKWECGLCKSRKATAQQISMHVNRVHNVKHKYQCVHCKFGGLYLNIVKHLAEKHPTKVQEVKCMFYNINDLTEKTLIDNTTPIWRRDPARVKNIRGILMEDEEESRKNLNLDEEEHDDISQSIQQAPKTAVSIDTNSSISTGTDKESINDLKLTPQLPKQIKTYGKSSKQLQKSEEISDMILTCTYCAFFTKNPTDYENHIKNVNHENLSLDTADYSFLCYHCPYAANTILDVREHWEKLHNKSTLESCTDKDKRKELPFRFRVVPQVCCARCDFKHEAFSVLRHHAKQHANLPPAFINGINNKMCGQCFYVYTDIEDLSKHFKQDHKKVNYTSFHVSNDLLEKLLLQGYSQGLNAKKCLRCNSIFFDEKTFELHNVNCVPNSPILCEYIQNEVLYSCCQCNFIADESSVVKHMQSHRFRYAYKCFSCKEVLKFFSEFVDHLQKAHNALPNQYTISRCVNTKIKKLREINVIFPNGLILKKSQLIGGKFGDTELITKAAKEEFAKYMQLSAKRSLSVSDEKEVGPPKSKPRLDDMNSDDVLKDFDKKTKSQDISKDIEISKDSEKVKTYPGAVSKGIMKKRPIPEKVDLSKIFTVMNFGGKQVPISCDRFAKLVKINVRVKMEKLNLSKYLTGSSILKRRSQSPSQDVSEPSKKPKNN